MALTISPERGAEFCPSDDKYVRRFDYSLSYDATGAAEAGGRPRPQRLPVLIIEDDLYGVLYFET